MVERFVKIPRDVLVMSSKTLGSTAKLVYGAIVNRIGKNGKAWPGYRRVADDIGATKPAVERAVENLDRLGLLVVGWRAGPRGCNLYSLPTGHETLPLEAGDWARNVAATGNETLPRLVTKRCQNKTKELDPTIRPIIARDEPEPMLIPEAAQGSTPKAGKGVKLDPWRLATEAMSTDALRTDAFQTAWGEWVEYRREARKRLAKSTIGKQIRLLEGLGHDAAIRSIQNSITNGWQGLFYPQDRGGTGAPGGSIGGPPQQGGHNQPSQPNARPEREANHQREYSEPAKRVPVIRKEY